MAIGRRIFLRQAALLGAIRSGTAQSRSSRSLESRLIDALDSFDIFDSHEHFWEEAKRTSDPCDFFKIAEDYALSDIISAGATPDAQRLIRDSKAADDDRWRAFEPFWKFARYTGYGQALRIAARDIYGIEAISGATIARLNAAIRVRNKPGLYREIITRQSRIRACVQDDYWNATPRPSDQGYYVSARRFDRFIVPGTPEDIKALEKLTDTSIVDLRTLKQATARSFEQNLAAGMATVKVGLAYMRELLFHEISGTDAARDFEALMRRERPIPEGFRRNMVRPFRNLEDHMLHYVVELADAHGIPVQIHTGLHAGNRDVITNSRPTLLTNVFLLHPKVQFDLFHISYPYQAELCELTKSFPNVFADFCWAYVISPATAARTLDEFLDTVPVNKIMGFGGDYHYPELSYAHLKIAKRIVAQTLAARVTNGFCTEEEAVGIGRLLLHDNAEALFLRGKRLPMKA